MKYNKKILWLLVILLSACTNENKNNYRLSFDSVFQHHLTLVDDKGNEIMYMNFHDDGTLVAFQVTDKNRNFSVIFNFDDNSINSYSVADRFSNYGSATTFFPGEETILYRSEQFDKLLVKERILNDGSVIIQTSNIDDYTQEAEDYLEGLNYLEALDD
jgi:hypothetical protein